MNHYIIYRRHSIQEGFFSYSDSPRSAMRAYALSRFAVEDAAGRLVATSKDGTELTFENELQAIECCEKVIADEWSMQPLLTTDWTKPLADSFCGDHPDSIEEIIGDCREVVGLKDDLPAGAFVWYLRQGAMVTFYRPNDGDIIAPDAIQARYVLLFSGTWPNVVRWSGSYDDLLDQLSFGPHATISARYFLRKRIDDREIRFEGLRS